MTVLRGEGRRKEETTPQYFTPDQVAQILKDRTAAIRLKILENRPKFVVMYGMKRGSHT
jgi:hypothetical protein